MIRFFDVISYLDFFFFPQKEWCWTILNDFYLTVFVFSLLYIKKKKKKTYFKNLISDNIYLGFWDNLF
ncbi:hypothetical protein DDB_G0285733 [Dictyostelium discoideum AX4]|uniref:hypothetical protein n=1 Tax=Dictyostelium discoideum AX4 TaxID=352472 RepID=UPI00004E43E5|nr:hypothetical protein DDB_G0285733 [Dictyostelium discoideum AX4]EAL64704.1 hypothetical protein DDB_G0285733 [Dictyostelium discoideum AX4]|eukprot:XP_638217.1 hypothetical protein DDB_G0285733 [Dictyostelium discoideum AX4]